MVGRVDVSRMLGEMSSEDFTEWKAYEKLEPFGPLSEEWRIANLTSIIANVNRNPKKRSQPFTAKDFMRNYEEKLLNAIQEEKPMSRETLAKKFSMIMHAFGGK